MSNELYSKRDTQVGVECGKAVAWVDTLDVAQPRCVTNLDYRSVAEAELGVEYIPLFLSSTIPEGYVLVPIEPTPKMVDSTWNEGVRYPAESHNTRNKRIYRAMIAAAQGERK